MSSSSGPDLFVVCKQCHSEVSPYITECPYCGARLRKRAPKLDREGRIAERPRRARRTAPRPTLGRLRRGEIPGIRAEVGRPWVTMAVVVASLVALLVERFKPEWIAHIVVFTSLGHEPWRVVTSSLAYDNTGYAFIALSGIALFGWLVERRHGHVVALLVMLLGGAAGMALEASVDSLPFAIGGNAVALALIITWAVPDVLARRRGEEIEGDLLGALVFAVVVAVVPAFVPEASWLAAAGGAVVGLVCGLLLYALAPSRS